MAESVQQKCLNCKKMGMVRCDGCDQRFCSTHFNDHRHHLDSLFERVCNDRDSLCEQINNPRPTSSSNHPQLITLLSEINEWESKTLKMVKQTADHARQRFNELMNSNNKAAEGELDKLSKELRRRKEDDDYFEQDIKRLSKQLEQIQIDLNAHVPHIRINVMSIDWSTVIQIVTEVPKRNIIHQQQNQLFVGGTLLTTYHQVQLNRFYGNENQEWKLVYKATKNGFDSRICHQCCDNQGPTLTVIQSSEGYLFGGYTAASWDIENNLWMVDTTAFLFTLTNPHNILPTKYTINSDGRNAIRSGYPSGLAFGCWDIRIYLQKNHNSQSNIDFPQNYIDSTGRGNSTFTGSVRFSTPDIEIYRLASN
jgi:archaellum component FlaC